MREKIEEKNHMLFSDSAQLAKKCGAKRLWLTHYSPALERPRDGIHVAEKIFSGAIAARDGEMLTIEK
jgi:ribonuclease Z